MRRAKLILGMLLMASPAIAMYAVMIYLSGWLVTFGCLFAGFVIVGVFHLGRKLVYDSLK